MQYSLEFQVTLSQNLICYNWLSMSGDAKIIHCTHYYALLPHQNWAIWVRNAGEFFPIALIDPQIVPFPTSCYCPTQMLPSLFRICDYSSPKFVPSSKSKYPKCKLNGRIRFPRWDETWTLDIISFCVIQRHASKMQVRHLCSCSNPQVNCNLCLISAGFNEYF